MEYISTFFLQIMDLLVYSAMAFALYDNQISRKKYIHLLLGVIASFILMICHYFDFGSFETVYIFCVICYLALIMNGSLLQRFKMTLAILMIVLFIQSSIMLFFKNENSLYYELNLLSLTLAVAMLSVAGIIYLLRKKRKNVLDWNDIPSYLYLNILIAFSGTFFPLLSVTWLKDYLTLKLNVAIVTSSYLVAICSVITIILYTKNYKDKNQYFSENQIKEKLLEMQKNYYLDLVKNYEDIRRFKHDFQAHMRMIKVLEENKRYNELHDYLNNMDNEMNKSVLFKCNNVYVSAIVNSFISECRENQIDLDVIFDVNGDIEIHNVYLCSLLHNLLSNAIEEQMKINTNKRIIELKIMNSSRSLIIDLTNNISKDFDLDNITLKKTSKKDSKKHGIGLYNIYNIVEMYHGNIRYNCNDKKFNTNIVLLDCVKES